jgi:hypothetical protein
LQSGSRDGPFNFPDSEIQIEWEQKKEKGGKSNGVEGKVGM